ncbi:MAG TPA: hypothetical protein VE861_11400, partial [Gemmatimonadaceae bacterium]|nr:hypothetical protein [Gemmatimonadaceae bacterium]
RTTVAQVGLAVLTYALVNITWVFFRSKTFAGAWLLLQSMLLIDTSGAPLLSSYKAISAAVTITLLVATHWFMRNRTLHGVTARVPAPAVGLAWGVMLFLVTITNGGSSAFIYFQF